MAIWVDTDFGFDDLWALLVLRHLNVQVDGVSLVAGNVPLPQVIRNAQASHHAFNFKWPIHVGAEKPLHRSPETAERILGKFGMPSRGRQLHGCFPDQSIPDATNTNQAKAALDALAAWLNHNDEQHILALGPLTNIAQLLAHHPQHAKNIRSLTWMGGSKGGGNHSEYAEFNALADPEALSAVVQSGIPLKVIDLELCRQVTFSQSDMPAMKGTNHQLLTDLLGGYLDIALTRGRSSMAIYDPLAALGIATRELFNFVPASIHVHVSNDSRYGQTVFNPPAIEGSSHKSQCIEYASTVDSAAARKLCMEAFYHA